MNNLGYTFLLVGLKQQDLCEEDGFCLQRCHQQAQQTKKIFFMIPFYMSVYQVGKTFFILYFA